MEADRQFFADNKTATCGDLRKAQGIPRIAARGIISEALELKPLRQVTAHRVKPANAAKRLEVCQLWDTQLRSGDLDAEKNILYGREVVSTRRLSRGESELCSLRP